jgi:hypothetical protein
VAVEVYGMWGVVEVYDMRMGVVLIVWCMGVVEVKLRHFIKMSKMVASKLATAAPPLHQDGGCKMATFRSACDVIKMVAKMALLT